jgi:ATPase subunit of ABC transporter with duplicated ATPase domains
MKIRFALPAILAAAVLSMPVLAASRQVPQEHGADKMRTARGAVMTPAEHCKALEQQFDNTTATREGERKAEEARLLRKEGGEMCAAGRYDEGIAKIQAALTDIGVRPVPVRDPVQPNKGPRAKKATAK